MTSVTNIWKQAKRSTLLCILFCMVLFVVTGLGAQSAEPPAGAGTVGDPYRISTLGNLVWVKDQAAANSTQGRYYALINNIDAAATVNWKDPYSTSTVAEGFIPIGADYNRPFKGNFDGGNYQISNLNMDRNASANYNYVGLFGVIDGGGAVKNLILSGCNINGRNSTGALAGAVGDGTVTNCTIEGGTVTCAQANSILGGLVGTYTGTVSNSHTTGSLTGKNITGGLVGHNSGLIAGCDSITSVTSYEAGTTVTGGGSVGGLVGWNYKGTVTTSFAAGIVNGTSCNFVGGLVGSNYWGVIDQSYSNATVTGTGDTGGLVGYNYGNNSETATVQYCYAKGTVTGNGSVSVTGGGSTVGGCVGNNFRSTIRQSYSTAKVTGAALIPGGFVGKSNTWPIGGVNDCYWDMPSSGLNVSAGGEGKLTADMKQQATYEGWDFSSTWGIDAGVTTPYFLALPYSAVSVNLLPGGVESFGGRWSIDGGANWKTGQDVVPHQDWGLHSICFAAAKGFDTPSTKTLMVYGDPLTTTSATYVVQTGIIRGTLVGPSEARWKIDNFDTAYSSGSTVTVSADSHVVTFTDVVGWDKPATQTLTVKKNKETSFTASYICQTGTLEVNTTGPTSARWWLDNQSSQTFASGMRIQLPPGLHTVHFTSVEGWVAPDSQTVTIGRGTTSVVNVAYAQNSLIVNIVGPPDARWWIDNKTTQMYKSGDSVMVDPGTHTIHFTPVGGWEMPASQPVTIKSGEVSVVNATYISNSGTVTVTINGPSSARWYLDNNASNTYASGATVTAVSGSHYVNFTDVNGYAKPLAIPVTVQKGQQATASGTYVGLGGTVTVTLEGTTSGTWSVNNGGTWHGSGESATVPAGSVNVIFGNVAGLNSPVTQTVTLANGDNVSLTGKYSPLILEDIELVSGSFTATQVAPGDKMGFEWDARSSGTVTGWPFWCEIFASKTGGFDQVRFGSTVTNSYLGKDLLVGETKSFQVNDLTVNALPDGVYSLMPSVNRGSLPDGQRLVETNQNYVNNWDVISGKRLTVRNTKTAEVNMQMVSAVFSSTDTEKKKQVSVDVVVKNDGPKSLKSPGCWVEVFYGYLTTEGSLVPEGTIGPGQIISTLDAGSTLALTISGTVPKGWDTRALAVMVDSTDIVPETDETDNADLQYLSGVLPPGVDNGVDLVIKSVSVDSSYLAPNQLTPDSRLRWSAVVENRGTTVPQSPVFLELFGSQDGGLSVMRGATITKSDVVLVPDPGASATYTFNQPLNSIGPGMYTLVAVINRTGVPGNPGDETPLDNRYVFSGGRVSLAQATAKNVNITWLAGPNFSITANQALITGTVKNTGTDAAQAFWIEAFAGTFQKRTGYYQTEQPIGPGVLCEGLAAGATQAVSIVGYVESGKVVGVIADSTDIVAETDETDNYDYSELVK